MNPEEDRPALRLTLPATSANLGPGFDAVGLALSLTLEVDARLANDFSITASGRDANLIQSLDNNLILSTYTAVLQDQGRPIRPLRLALRNQIPLGMGCGSSAAALCAGVYLANTFGALQWSTERILSEAARREGHPDNVAACVLGGFTVSRTLPAATEGAATKTITATCGDGLSWRLLLALPKGSLATHAARALLPGSYSRADAVQNVQTTALLVSAFALDRPDLLRAATQDRLHQPYRQAVCPLFQALEGLASEPHVFGVTLSGAGPSVLLIVDEQFEQTQIAVAAGPHLAEILAVEVGAGVRREEFATGQ